MEQDYTVPHGARLYCSTWNKTVLNKSFYLWSKTYYVIKWFCSDTQISETTCFLLLKVMKKQEIRISRALSLLPPPYLCSIYVLCAGGLHTIHFFRYKKTPKITKLQKSEYKKWQKAWVIIDNAASKSMLLLKDQVQIFDCIFRSILLMPLVIW